MSDDRSTEYLYKEYARLSTVLEQLMHGSFEDFKLLAVVGAVVSWPAFANILSAEVDVPRPVLMLAGFAVILLLVAIIGTRDILKQSLISYYAAQLVGYEQELRRQLELGDSSTFQLASGARDWFARYHGRITLRFQLLFVVLLVAFPAIVLTALPPRWSGLPYALVYTVLAGLVYVVYISARMILIAMHGDLARDHVPATGGRSGRPEGDSS